MLGHPFAKRQLFTCAKGIHLQYEHLLHRCTVALKSSSATFISFSEELSTKTKFTRI